MYTPSKNVRVRFAPSPTGYLHVGSLRTALYNYLFARHHGGTFILRIEDTDRNRLVADAAEKLVKTLSIFFDWSEGMKQGTGSRERGTNENNKERQGFGVESFGDFAPYMQSERTETYRKYADELVEKKRAYPCFCTAERLDEVRKAQQARKEPTRYDRHCLELSESDREKLLAQNMPHVIRMHVEEGEDIAFDDMVRGTVTFSRDTVDDQVLMKSDGFPTYHLANVVDDHLMEISHVIRGEEWLSSTPKHILLYEAFGWETPKFAHIPLLLNPDRSKLSKRQGDVAVEDYLSKGYVPEALLNFVALLGWNPGEGSTQEIFSLEELVENFDIAHVHKSGAVFDVQKLNWLNKHYIESLSSEVFCEKAKPFLFEKPWFMALATKPSERVLKRMMTIEQSRLDRLSDIGDACRFFFEDPSGDAALLPWKKNSQEETAVSLHDAMEFCAELSEAEWETHETLTARLLERAGEKRGDFLWPLRVALSGEQKSPPPGEIAWVIGRDATLRRIESAIRLLESPEKMV